MKGHGLHMMKGHGLHRSEHLTADETVGGDGADLLPAVEDAELAVVLLDAGVVAGQAAADEDAVAVEGDLAAGADLADVLDRVPTGLNGYGTPNGTRTRVFAVKGRCPRPLDDGRRQRGGL